MKWAFVSGIVVILNLFFIFSIQLAYEKPVIVAFCPDSQVRVVPQTRDECLEVGGQWTDGQYVVKGLPRPGQLEPAPIETIREGYCYPEYTCSQEYEDARKLYERNFFIALIILGTVILLGSFVIRRYEVIVAAFSWGGVCTFIVASIRYWPEMHDYVRVTMLGIALAALLWAGVKRFKE